MSDVLRKLIHKIDFSIVIVTVALLPSSVAAQNVSAQGTTANGTPQDDRMALSASMIADATENSVVNLAMKYLEPLNGIGYENIGCALPGKKPCNLVADYRITPEIDMKAGDNGSFQGINGKLVGQFRLTSLEPDADGMANATGIRHVIPVSLGGATTRFGDQFAVLGEVGWVPWLPPGSLPGKGRSPFTEQVFTPGYNPYFGVFFQGGYKFKGFGANTIGGSVDESSEPLNAELFRFKTDFKFTLDLPKLEMWGEGQFLNPKLITSATGWYDIAHNDIYYALAATLRMNMSSNEKMNFDLKIKSGSGEPNFNKGTQFGAGLTVTF